MTEIGRRDVLRGAAGMAALSVLPSVASAAQSVVDETGQKKVTVEVGAEGNGGAFAFSPANVRVDPGTTVIWKWTGKGGMHNVVADDGSFGSDMLSDAGATFEHTFEKEAAFEYACEPHRAMGMVGTVLVGDATLAAGSEQTTTESADSTDSTDSAESTDESALSDPDYGDWFGDVDNFDGTVDMTGKKTVTLEVGSEANGGGFGFGPAAVRVDPGTTVTWEWTGNGGSHNVAAEDGSFKSDMLSDAGATFEHTFEEKGITKYACEPHKSMGMKGAVVVGGKGGVAPAESGLSTGELALGGSLVTALLSPIVFALFLFGRRGGETSAPTRESTPTQGAKRPQP
ncbi:halocyanin domain-containing protein [Haladaptatus sp. NG-SE-30]